MQEIPRKRTPRSKKQTIILFKSLKPKVVKKNDEPTIYKSKKPITATQITDDYLKYFRLVRLWACANANLKYLDFEFVLFLYSESLFTKERFRVFERSMSYNRKRFDIYIEKGIIMQYGQVGGKTGKKTLYTLTFKAKSTITSMYKMLAGERNIPKSFSQDRQLKQVFSRGGRIAVKNFRKEFERHNVKKPLFDAKNDFLGYDSDEN
jgi:hypothetical protein